MSFKRLFVAIDVPNAIKRQFQFLNAVYDHEAIRWIPDQNIHITVHFIGKTNIKDLHDIIDSINNIAQKVPSFELVSHSLKIITKRKKEVMIWAAIEPSESFKFVAEQLRHMLPGDSDREQTPHLTLARINPKKNPPPLGSLPGVEPFTIYVHQIELWESITSDSNPVYKCLKTFTFKK